MLSMLKITFSESDVQALQQQRFAHPEAVVRIKMEALYLKSQGVAHQDIARWCGISTNTLRRYFRQYLAGGLEQLQEKTRYCPHSALDAHRIQLQAAFQQHPPTSVTEAAARIAELTGIRRQPTQVRAFLKTLGFKRLKVGSVPAKADAAQQERFLQEQLQPRLEEAKAAQRTVFFVDAAHFVHGPFLGFVWCLTRFFIKAPCGRQRLNVLAALHAVTQEVITVTNSSYITAESGCLLLCQLAQSCSTQSLTVVLDNARYQRCGAVQECAAQLDIELLYLPPVISAAVFAQPEPD
jgi:transposase